MKSTILKSIRNFVYTTFSSISDQIIIDNLNSSITGIKVIELISTLETTEEQIFYKDFVDINVYTKNLNDKDDIIDFIMNTFENRYIIPLTFIENIKITESTNENYFVTNIRLKIGGR